MIKEISHERLTELAVPILKKQKIENALLIRICSNAECFCAHSLCTPYEITKSGKFCGLILIYSGLMTIWVQKKPDFDELCGFVATSGVCTLEADRKIAKEISSVIECEKTEGKIFYIKKVPDVKIIDNIISTENVSNFFDALRAAHPAYENTQYEAFYCDVFYRAKLPAKLFLLKRNGNFAATAAIMHTYSKSSIMSDISVIPSMRRKGIASEIVSAVCSYILSESKVPMLFCVSKGAMKMYRKLGFRVQRNFTMLKF